MIVQDIDSASLRGLKRRNQLLGGHAQRWYASLIGARRLCTAHDRRETAFGGGAGFWLPSRGRDMGIPLLGMETQLVPGPHVWVGQHRDDGDLQRPQPDDDAVVIVMSRSDGVSP